MTNVFSSIDARVDVVRRYRPIEELVPRHWQEGDVEANGIRQHILRTGGSGSPLVLLHGFMEGAIAWLPGARALESDYDVVMLDARGHGRSARAGGHFEPEILAKDAATALAALKLSGSVGREQRKPRLRSDSHERWTLGKVCRVGRRRAQSDRTTWLPDARHQERDRHATERTANDS